MSQARGGGEPVHPCTLGKPFDPPFSRVRVCVCFLLSLAPTPIHSCTQSPPQGTRVQPVLGERGVECQSQMGGPSSTLQFEDISAEEKDPFLCIVNPPQQLQGKRQAGRRETVSLEA